MRICFISECYPSPEKPQYCVFLEQQAKALKELDNKVEIIVIKAAGEERTYLKNGLTVSEKLLKRRTFDKLYADYNQRVERLDIHWQEYDCISIHIVSVPITEALIKMCKKFGKKVIVHYHGLNVWHNYFEKNDILHKVIKYVEIHRKVSFLKKADAIIGVSDSVCNIVRQKINSKHIYRVYNGVDNTLFTVKEKRNKGPFQILCVANLITIKGQRYLLQAVSTLVHEGKSIRLKLIGEGPDKKELKEFCEAECISNIVDFAGALPYCEVIEAMQESDMFIMPSYFESFGCVYLESMSTGTVTCGCNCYGPSEIIENGKNGLLVQPHDSSSIKDIIELVMQNESLRCELEKNGVIRAKDFTWQKSAQSLMKVYDSLE